MIEKIHNFPNYSEETVLSPQITTPIPALQNARPVVVVKRRSLSQMIAQPPQKELKRPAPWTEAFRFLLGASA